MVVVVAKKTHCRGDLIQVIWYAGFGAKTCFIYTKPSLYFFHQKGLRMDMSEFGKYTAIV